MLRDWTLSSRRQTWDQFGTVMQRLTKNLSGGDGQVLGFNPTYVSVGTSIWETWFWELGGSYLSADGTHVTIANDAGVGALDWMVKQAQVQGGWNAITSYWSAAGKNAGSATAQVGWGFGLQKVAMLAEVGNAITNLRTHWPGIRYGVAGIPAAASGKRASVRGGYSWVLPTGATAPDTAWAFLEWAFAAEQSLAFKNQFTRIPTTLDAIKSPKWPARRSHGPPGDAGCGSVQPTHSLHLAWAGTNPSGQPGYSNDGPGREFDGSDGVDDRAKPDSGNPGQGAARAGQRLRRGSSEAPTWAGGCERIAFR